MNKGSVMRLLILLGVLLSVTVPLWAGGGGEVEEEGVTTLTVMMHTSWLRPGAQAAFDLVNERAEELGARLVFERVPEGASGEQVIQARLASGDYPDILYWQLANVTASRLGRDNIDDLFEDLSDLSFTRYYDAERLSWPAYTQNGRLIQAPFNDSTVFGVFYNRRVFEEAGIDGVPTTWEEFLEACRRIEAIGRVPVYYSINDAWTGQLIPLIGLAQEQRAAGIADLARSLSTNEMQWADLDLFITALERTLELVERGYINDTFLSDTYAMAQQALMNGEAGMYVQGTWMIPDLAGLSEETLRSDIGGFAFPVTDDAWIVANTPTGLYVLSGGRNPELSKRIVDFLVSPEAMNTFFQAQPGIPFISTGVEVAELYPVQEDFLALIEAGRAGPDPTAFLRYTRGPLERYVAEMLVGDATPREIAQRIDENFAEQARDADDPNW